MAENIIDAATAYLLRVDEADVTIFVADTATVYLERVDEETP